MNIVFFRCFFFYLVEYGVVAANSQRLYFGEVFTWNTCLSSVVAGDVMAVVVVVVLVWY